MNEVKKLKWASAKKNPDFFLIETFSGYRASGRDPLGKQHFLPVTASAKELGEALQDALTHSRFLSLDEIDVFFDYEKRAEAYKLWIFDLMQRYGYKSKRALFKNMATCHIDVAVDDGQMTIAPLHHDGLESWRRVKDDGIEDVFLRADSPDDRVGQALVTAFNRCT